MKAGEVLRVFDRAGCRAVDRESIEHYGVPGIVLMENAARALADAAMELLGADRATSTEKQPPVLIVCGPGNNGGDGYAAARHLHNRGVEVMLGRWGMPREDTDARINHDICERMGLPFAQLHAALPPGTFRGMLDCLLGTGLDRPVEGRAREIIEWMNGRGVPIIAADLPSGLDCDTGEPLGVAVRATATVSFVGLKRGFLNPRSHVWTGHIITGDIGAPRELVERYARDQSPGSTRDDSAR